MLSAVESSIRLLYQELFEAPFVISNIIVTLMVIIVIVIIVIIDNNNNNTTPHRKLC